MFVASFSGIRGIWGESLTRKSIESYVQSYGRWILSHTKNPLCVIGRDTRPSSEAIEIMIFQLWTDMGIRVERIGIFPTPVIQHAVRHFTAHGGVIVTASHNPKEWNGMKFLRNDGGVLFPEEMQMILDHSKTEKNTVTLYSAEHIHNEIQKEIISSYMQLLSSIIPEKNLSGIPILIDCNGGAATSCIQEVVDFFDIEASYIGQNPGDFWREIEPNQENLSNVQKYFNENTQFAVCFDCDADRVECVLPDGRVVSGQQVLALIFEILLPHSKKTEVVITDATSLLVSHIAKQYGKNVIEVEVGEANVVKKMQERDAEIGGEGSSGGGIIFPGRSRDGIVSFLLLLSLCKQKNLSLTQIVDNLPDVYNTSYKWTEFSFQNVRSTFESYANTHKYQIQTTGDATGGIKIWISEQDSIWARGSKTEYNLVRCILDGYDQNILENTYQEIVSQLQHNH